jgi:hypothetical protein
MQQRKRKEMYLPFSEKPHKIDYGIHRLYGFEGSQYGASVVRFCSTDTTLSSYGGDEGLWELAVIRFDGRPSNDNFKVVYDTPITDNVIGWLNEEGVQEVLHQVAMLEE